MPDGSPREAIEQDLELTCGVITIAAGYDLPDDFMLLTRELLMYDQVGGRYPALIIQAEEAQKTFIELGWTTEARLGIRFIVYFRPLATEKPATTANRYERAIERGVMLNPGRSGYADWTEADHTPIPLIWRDSVSGPILEMTTHATVVYTYDPREDPVIP